MLETGISSTQQSLRFWGIAAARPKAAQAPPGPRKGTQRTWREPNRWARPHTPPRQPAIAGGQHSEDDRGCTQGCGIAAKVAIDSSDRLQWVESGHCSYGQYWVATVRSDHIKADLIRCKKVAGQFAPSRSFKRHCYAERPAPSRGSQDEDKILISPKTEPAQPCQIVAPGNNTAARG